LFWCSEHVFEAVGVDEAISGYAGGTTKNPSYEQVGSNNTGHAEAIVYYDPKVISFKELVNVFRVTRPDNSQSTDRGSSYRSIAFIKCSREENY
jgi:peptide-methionine (S)-S-oxide reductase